MEVWYYNSMGIYAERACENFKNGYSCAQSLLLAFASVVNLDEEVALKISSSFGGGMGRMRDVCGAVSSMFMVAGLLKGFSSPNDMLGKTRQYQLVQSLAKKFFKVQGSLICRDILGLPPGWDSPLPSVRTKQYYEERPCEGCIRTAAELIENELL